MHPTSRRPSALRSVLPSRTQAQRRPGPALVSLIVVAVLGAAAGATAQEGRHAGRQGPEHGHHEHHASTAGDAGPALEVVEAFHAALAAQDSDAVLDLLTEDVRIFESGGVESSREEYASHHLGADMKFSAATTREIVDRRGAVHGEIAWVLATSRTRGQYGDREIDAKGTETILLRQTPAGWRIFHIHWSSR